MNRPLVLTDPTGLQSGKKPKDDEPIRVNTDLSSKAPTITKVTVTSNGKPIEDDLIVGDQFTVTYSFRINKPDDGSDPANAGRIEGLGGDRTTKWDEKGQAIATETETTKGTIADVEQDE